MNDVNYRTCNDFMLMRYGVTNIDVRSGHIVCQGLMKTRISRTTIGVTAKQYLTCNDLKLTRYIISNNNQCVAMIHGCADMWCTMPENTATNIVLTIRRLHMPYTSHGLSLRNHVVIRT